jgi:hypothetical protein
LQRQQLKSGDSDEGEKRRQRQLTVTMLGATLTFILLSLPYSLHALIAVIDKGYRTQGAEADPRRYHFFVFIEVHDFLKLLLTIFPTK